MDISVVIPLFNEEESLPELHAWIQRVMNTNGFTYEIIFINDGSTDSSWNVIEDFSARMLHTSMPSSSVATMERALPSTVASRLHRAMSSSQWMPTFRILPMRFPSCTE